MLRPKRATRAALALAVGLALVPTAAFGAEGASANAGDAVAVVDAVTVGKVAKTAVEAQTATAAKATAAAQAVDDARRQAAGKTAEAVKAAKEADDARRELVDKVLEYDRSLIAEIGTQKASGHTICCPSFSCAYGDAIIDGTVHDHSYYTCYSCRWTDWGGGASSNRRVGTDEELLREAYDQILSGKPTVIHVAASYGEHWICLFGYHNAKDPDHLSLSNFVALDPWDGAEVNPGDLFTLYGDGCEHISDR